MARIPIKSGLNIDTWHRHLVDYPDNRLVEYLTYGFPLSITDSDRLCNHNISNHYSAIQFPTSIDQYLQKETDLGAMLGPFDHIDAPFYHCSPLLTRPKGNNDRRVILNLSYPAGASLNDAVTKHLFDGQAFTLKFPTVDSIVDAIKKIKGRPMMAKIDISRAFRNLRVDPADAFKFGIKWKGKYYLDRAVAFGWVHGSVAFHMTPNAVIHTMSKFCLHRRFYTGI